MADWDADSPRLQDNLEQVLRSIRDRAPQRAMPSVKDARGWHAETLAGLRVPHPDFVGGFRGEEGALKNRPVWIGNAPGVRPAAVADELKAFEERLQKVVAEIDKRYAVGAELDADGLAGVLELAAWAHAEWVRIHPFANGNGRTARLWANALLMRYGVPPVVTLRPRPKGDYAEAAAKAMDGDWQPTVAVFRAMLLEFLREATPPSPKPRGK